MQNLDITYHIQLKSITFCRYELIIGDQLFNLSFAQLLQLRNKLNHYCSTSVLEKIIETDNFVLLFLADKQHLLYLDIPQLLDLKEEINLFFYKANTSLF